MTTIAYKDGVIAYDSRLTFGGAIMNDDQDKKVVMGEYTFFLCGAVDQFSDFISGFYAGSVSQLLDVEALVVDGVTVLIAGIDGLNVERTALTFPWAIGTGAEYAIGAMDAGKTAFEAVDLASHRDPGTGGRIRTYKVYDQ